MIGKTISHYKILEEIGEGGMGVVYKATDTVLLRPVAIKVLSEKMITSESSRLRFLQEAQMVAALSHPNICTVYDVIKTNGSMGIVMEYLQGRTVREILLDGLPERSSSRPK